MSKRPYFIKKDLGDTSGLDMFLYQDMDKYIGDLLSGIKINPYYNKILLQIFHEISTMPRFVDASKLPIANYDSVPAWEKIVRVCVEMIVRSYLVKMKKELFEALELTIYNLGTHQKTEYYSQEDLPKIITVKKIEDLKSGEKVAPADRLRKMLIHYHDLYDGTYKACLSFYHFLCDLLEGKYSYKKPFDDYLNKDDVSYKINKINEYSTSIKLQYNISWLLIGSDRHIRNAIAHKRWEFKQSTVILKDKDGWSKEFNFIEIEDLIRSLNIANKGMQSAILIGYSKYMEEISKSLPRRELDDESIHSIMYHLASNVNFLLDDIDIKKGFSITCRLIEGVIPFNRKVIFGSKKSPLTIDLPPIPKRSYRLKSFIYQSLPAIWNFKKIRIEAFDMKDNAVGIMEVNIEKWSEMYQSEQDLNKGDFEKYVLSNTIIDKV